MYIKCSPYLTQQWMYTLKYGNSLCWLECILPRPCSQWYYKEFDCYMAIKYEWLRSLLVPVQQRCSPKPVSIGLSHYSPCEILSDRKVTVRMANSELESFLLRLSYTVKSSYQVTIRWCSGKLEVHSPPLCLLHSCTYTHHKTYILDTHAYRHSSCTDVGKPPFFVKYIDT